MMTLLIIIHVIACIVLIGLVLIQRGRGAGLVESFAGVESMFGPKTSTFLTKATTILSTLFFITCVTLAVLSARQNKSLMPAAESQKAVPTTPDQQPLKVEVGTEETNPKSASPATEPAPTAETPLSTTAK